MREIKFRAWDKLNKKMIWGPTEGSINSAWVYTLATGGGYDDVIELMQFTGLLDKNGKEIFEGDIYIGERSYMPSRGHKSKKYPQRIKVICVVKWSNYDAGWRPKEIGPIPEHREADKNVPYHYYHTSLGSDNGIADWIEVIGNIHEDAHLINKP